MSTHPHLVVGAGPTGLSAAYHLGAETILVERETAVGGLCRSVECDGFTFDMAGHIMFSNDPYVHELYSRLLKDNIHWQEREAWIYSKGTFTRYPFQGSLYGLPPGVIRECLLGAIQARHGDWREAYAADMGSAGIHPPVEANARCEIGNGVSGKHSVEAQCVDRRFEDCCADGIVDDGLSLATATARPPTDPGEPGNFEEFIYRVWGAGIARHFAIPYNRKLWGHSLRDMETSWLGGRVPLPDLEEMIEGALTPSPRPMGPNARFGYPLRGGFEALVRGFLPLIQGEVRLATELVRVDPGRKRAEFRDGAAIDYETLISTMPLPELVRCLGNEAPEEIQDAAAGLRRVSVRCVNLGIGRPDVTDKHWIYYPEDTVFHRIFVQGNASPHNNRKGGFGLTCEISYSDHKRLPCDGRELVERCVADCRRVGMLRPGDPLWTWCMTDIPYAYVVYDHERADRVRRVREWLLERDIVLGGRYSEWEYYNSDHAFLAGRDAAFKADEIRSAARTRDSGSSSHRVN